MDRRFDSWHWDYSDSGTLNIFLLRRGKLVRKIWIYPDGHVTYRDFKKALPTPEKPVIEALPGESSKGR